MAAVSVFAGMTGKNRHFRDLSQQVLSGVVAFLILSPPLQSFHVVLPKKDVSFVFFLVELCLPVAYFLFNSLSFSCSIYSKFVDMTINLLSLIP